MSTDDYNQEMEERARLIAEINAAKAELAMQIELNRQLRVDLQVSQAAAIESIKYSKALAASFIPLMNGVAEEVKKEYDIDILSPFQFYTKYKTKQL